MLSSTDFSSPPKFKKEYKKMRAEYEKAFLDDFSSKQMMPKAMWDRKYELYFDEDQDNDDFYARVIYQFQWLYQPKRKLYHLEMDVDYGDMGWKNNAYEDLCYPQLDLGKKYFEFEKKSACSFLPKPDNIERFKEMYWKIKDVEDDLEKWIEALMETNDHKFVFHNIEYRLGEDLDNKELWKLYINYLKTHDTQKLLQTYSKYIRFFLEDEEMVTEYREAVNKHGPVLVPWKNTQDFETFDENFFEKEAECQSYQRTLPVESPPSLPQFNAEGMIRQNFPFHDNLMYYIRKNASAEVLHKLYKTCKFFYQSLSKTLCYKFEVNEMNLGEEVDDDDDEVDEMNWGEEVDDDDSDEEVDEDSNDDDSDEEIDDASQKALFMIKNLYLKVSSEWLANTNVDNLFISNVFHCASSEDPLVLSKIIPKIYKCSATIIELYRQLFSLDDLKVLIGHGNVLSLQISDGNCFILEDILQLTPCIKDIRLQNCIQCTADRAKKLYEMEFKNKIDCIGLYELKNDLLDPHDFAKFVLTNCLPDAFVGVEFVFDGKEEYVANFKEILHAALGSYLKEDNLRIN